MHKKAMFRPRRSAQNCKTGANLLGQLLDLWSSFIFRIGECHRFEQVFCRIHYPETSLLSEGPGSDVITLGEGFIGRLRLSSWPTTLVLTLSCNSFMTPLETELLHQLGMNRLYDIEVLSMQIFFYGASSSLVIHGLFISSAKVSLLYFSPRWP